MTYNCHSFNKHKQPQHHRADSAGAVATAGGGDDVGEEKELLPVFDELSLEGAFENMIKRHIEQLYEMPLKDIKPETLLAVCECVRVRKSRN